MKIAKLPIKDCYKILFKPNKDGRGYFTRTYCKKEFKKFGVNDKWVQNNLSFNKNKSTFSCSIGGTPIATMSGLSCKIIFFHEVKYLNGKLLLISLLDFPDIPIILNLSDI